MCSALYRTYVWVHCTCRRRAQRTSAFAAARTDKTRQRCGLWPNYFEVDVTFTLIIRLEARLQPNIGFTLRRVFVVFTHSGITSPKVNRFGWNLEHSEYVVGGWPWQILGAILAVATAIEPCEFLFFLSGKQRTISTISRRSKFTKFECNTSISDATKTFGTEFWKFYRKGRLKMQKFLKKIVLRLHAS